MNMKKFFIHLVVLLCIASSSFAQTKNHPGVDYNDIIVGEHHALLALVTDYLVQTVHSDDYKSIDLMRKQVIDQVENAISKIEALGPFEGDTKMRDEALEVLKVYKEAYTEDFNTINSLKAESQKSFEAMAQYLKAEELVEEKLNNTLKRFNRAQQEFAMRHNLTIENGKRKHPMDIIVQVYKYNREVFLQYFKVFIQNEACLNALYKQDGDLLDKERLKLLLHAQEARVTLKGMAPFQQDEQYKSSALSYISFHQEFAQDDMLKLVKIFHKDQITSEDIKQANRVLTKYNADLKAAEDAFHNANILLLQTYIPQDLSKENGG